jgi:hypothetical protein
MDDAVEVPGSRGERKACLAGGSGGRCTGPDSMERQPDPHASIVAR